MDILDAQGRKLQEVLIRLDEAEIADFLVGASSIDDGSADHAVIRDVEGRSVALYLGAPGDQTPIERQSDWWVGPIILVLVVVMAAGAYTLARGLVHVLFG